MMSRLFDITDLNVRSRRGFLKLTGVGIAALGLPAASVCKNATAPLDHEVKSMQYTMFYQPSLLRTQPRTAAWSNSIAVRDDRLYLTVPVQQFLDTPTPMGLAIAESADGVHWREIDPFACPLPHGLAGYCVRWTGREFIYFSSERNAEADMADYPVVLRQHRSPDLKTWECMGEAYTTRPDTRWYRSRWDELVILEDEGAFYGYITSEPLEHLAQDSLGMLQSPDGVRWEVIAPPVIMWDGLPPQQMEVCFCEKLAGRYYLGMGSRSYMGHLGYSVMVFVGDSPRGPFRPDKEAFRLCGTTTRDVTWLAKTVHWHDEILLSNWITTTLDKSYPGIFANGQSLWIGPLKKLITDPAGHLRIAWWPGNEAAGGTVRPIDLRQAEFAHPAAKYREAHDAMSATGSGAIALTAGRDGAIAMLPDRFDLSRGVIFEGTLKATEPRGRIGTHWHPAAAGFYFEAATGTGMLLQLETLGLTRIGLFEYAAQPTYDADEFALAAYGNVQRGGPYLGLSRFRQEDVTGPIGYATPCGIRNGIAHRFRLLARHGIMEFYLDDLLVQTYITGPATGRMGLFAKCGEIVFADFTCRELTPDSISI